MKQKQRIIVIAGPTASGKTALAIELALRFGGEIVNADSMQVYRGMDVGTAKPTQRERTRVLHHLLDVVDPDQDFNAGTYRSLALPVLKEIESRGRLAFVVGGTGLYIRVLLGGVLHCPPQDPGLRGRLKKEADDLGLPALHERLALLDPESSLSIHPHDRVRIVRALEVIHLTGQPFSAMVKGHRFRDKPFQGLKICLQIGRKQLYHRIDERCVRMLQAGLIRETEELLKKGYSPDLKSMQALGYRHMIRLLEGTLDAESALRELQADTRRYAKRQLTWFRADPEMVWLSPQDPKAVSDRVRDFLAGPGEDEDPS